MPIKSYLAVPKEGQKEALQRQVANLPQCEVTMSENRNVLIIITETANEEADKKLLLQLNQQDSMQLLTLVSAFSNQTELTHEQ